MRREASPRAAELRERVREIVHAAETALRPVQPPDLDRLSRTFTLRTRDGFVENFGAALVARVASEAPGVKLCFLPKLDKDNAPLRDGRVDLETGVVGKRTGPELRAQALLRDRFVGVVRKGHPLARGKVTAARYAAARHVVVSRRGLEQGPAAEDAMPGRIRREVVAVVSGFAEALALARGSDLVATVPERHTERLREGMFTFALPMSIPPLTVSLLWHPRMEGDPAHRWLRQCVRDVVETKRAA